MDTDKVSSLVELCAVHTTHNSDLTHTYTILTHPYSYPFLFSVVLLEKGVGRGRGMDTPRLSCVLLIYYLSGKTITFRSLKSSR